ncbi:MAG: hypothetical protein V1715_08460 [bacterium]
MKKLLIFSLLLFFGTQLSFAGSTDIAIKSAKGLVFPNNNVSISYDAKSQEVYIKFTTPSNYKINYALYYLRWMDNQWVVLQEFKKENAPVKNIAVETNYKDNSGFLIVTHSARDVDQYAKPNTYERWMNRGQFLSKGKNDTEWKKLDL